jgi:CheY-like chemotaxis protein
MPDIDGYELVVRVRQGRARIPALAVSAYARPEDRRRALAAGYDGYACKPIDTAAFLRTVKDVLRLGVGQAGGGVAAR